MGTKRSGRWRGRGGQGRSRNDIEAVLVSSPTRLRPIFASCNERSVLQIFTFAHFQVGL